jgi:hypothetical protein
MVNRQSLLAQIFLRLYAGNLERSSSAPSRSDGQILNDVDAAYRDI